MRFYVASFVGERQRTQQIQADLRERGHAITVDWTSFPGVPSPERNDRPEEVQAIAERDLEGIQTADVFILLAGVPDGRAKYAELGAAIMSAVQNGRPRIYVVGDSPVHSVFFFHPTVTRVSSIREVLTDLGQMGDVEKRLDDESWLEPPDLPSVIRPVALDGVRIPVLDLAYEKEAYRIMGRMDTVRRIEDLLRQHRCRDTSA